MPFLPRVRIDHRYLLSAGVVVFIAFRFVPWSSVASGLYAAIAISAALAGASGIRRDRPAERSAWVALVAGIALSAIVELARLLAVNVGGLESLKTPLDFVFVIASIAQLGGIVGLISERSTGRSRNSWLDAAAIGVAVFLTMWGTIEQTIRARASSSTFEWISQLGKPVLGGALIVMSVRLLLGEGRWRRSFMMLALGYLLHMANDIVSNIAPDYAPEGAVDALRALGFALIGASLLHPDRLVGPRPVPTLQARRDVNEVLAIQGVVVVALIGVIASTILEYTPMSTVVTWGVGGLTMLALNRIRIYGLLREVGDASITEHSRRLTALVEHSHEVIGVADGEGIVRFVSPAVEDMTGLAPSWWIGKHFPTIATQTVDGFEEFLLQVEHLRRAESASWQGEYSPRPGVEPRVIRFTIVNHLATPEVDGWVITARNVTDEARLTNELRHQALHDSLTGLPNRELLADRIGHALDRGRRTGEMALAVLLVDLDDFKSVNDSLGHDTGDELLKTVAGRLSDAIRPGDTVARLGGDEFAVLLEQTEEREALIVANRIMEGLALPLRVGDTDFAVQASIGAVASCRVTDPVELLRAADIAMYAAKRDGKGRVSIFRDHMHDEAKTQLTLRMDLAGALQRGELSLAYQPIVDTAAGEVRGFEALLRWQHPERGAIPPNDFIPIAEQTGLITPIGAWVLRSACAEAARWANRPGQPYVSVNVSALQLRDLEFVTTVADALRNTHLAPERLLLEITESMLINEAALTREALSQLRALGVRVAIDDFGTGYSSLAYLRELAVDVVKIDRSFIRDLAVNADHRALTSTMLALADGLSMTAIAEGVETDVELAELRHLGCEFAQGFLFSRPIPAAAIDPLLDEYEAHAARSTSSDAAVPDPS